ncbi:MAG: VWA domain-containing protein [Blastocatellia bacterium]|nr:VWA domain-containing protein [Blastocatellia bacterium]
MRERIIRHPVAVRLRGSGFALLGLVCGLVCLAVAGAFAQSTGRESQSVLRVETELVQLDVTVTDKQGRLVRDLKREEFALFEDGKPVALTHFAIGTASRPAVLPGRPSRTSAGPAAVVPPSSSTAGRYLVLAIDDLHMAAGNLPFTKQALLRFIDRQMSDEDQVALVTTSATLGLYQQFTSDREILRRAVNRLSLRDRTDTGDLGIPPISSYQAELIDQGDIDALEIAVRVIMRRGGGEQDRMAAVLEAQNRSRLIIQQNANVTIATLRTIEEVIRSLSPLAGRKVVALFSDGFLMGGMRDGRHYDLRRITDAAVRAGVSIYSLDTRGLSAGPASANAAQPFGDLPQDMPIRMRIENATIEGMRDGMHTLARDTGGIPLFNSNDLSLGLARLLQETETYYLLAFEPVSPYRDGRFRKLEVRVPGRPDLKVRTRTGYFAPDDKRVQAETEPTRPVDLPAANAPEASTKEAQAALQRQIREGLSSLFPLRGIPVQMTAGFVQLPEGGSAADIAAHIDASALNFGPGSGRHRAILEFVGVVFDEGGGAAERFTDRIDLNLRSKTMSHSLRNGLLYSRFVRLKPGLYQVRIAIREIGFAPIGSAHAWVEIPDLTRKELALSSIILGLPEDDVENAASSRKDSAAIDEDRLTSLPAKVYRRFAREGRFDFLVFAYNAQYNEKGSTSLVVQSQVYAGDKLVIATPVRLITEQNSPEVKKNTARGVPYRARLSLDGFAAGKYELRLVVIDRLAKASAKRSIAFTVE